MSIVKRAPRAERHRLERMDRKSKDPDEVRRALAVRRLMEGLPITEVASVLVAARSAVYRWAASYRKYGIEGLLSDVRGRLRRTVNDSLVEAVLALLDTTLQALGYLRSNWSSELLAKALEERYRLSAHASTVRRLLPKLGFGWRRACPMLCKRDPRKSARVDNYRPHTSALTNRWLALNPKFELLLQPAYHSWVNEIER